MFCKNIFIDKAVVIRLFTSRENLNNDQCTDSMSFLVGVVPYPEFSWPILRYAQILFFGQIKLENDKSELSGSDILSLLGCLLSRLSL